MKESSSIPKYVFDKNTGWRMDPVGPIKPGTRVLCLYRVSSDKQLYFTENDEADIPMQRVRCREFCESNGWTIVCELQEEGVSGHKIRAENRDKIQLIKEYALEGKFDILLVFMFDRIGRISDETPFVVEWLISHGIRVWSVTEGEQRIDSHTDRLTNYIRFWQADGESQKTSIRTANSLHILTEAGCFTGGKCPYGYQFVKSGRMNKKKQEVNDLKICESEAAIVRMIFDLAANEGYGAQRIANYLNAKKIKNRTGKNWHPASIQGMLRNVLYIGILRSGNSRSNVLEHLRIIDNDTFEIVQAMLGARSRSQEAVRSVPLNTRGQSLLAGNVFCAHCGARLCVTTSGKGRPKKDGTDTRRMRYTCQTKSRTHGECDGQTGYTVPKLDAMIETIIHSIFDKVRCLNQSELLDACYENEITEKKAIANKTKIEYNKATRDLQNLKDEIIKALAGESTFPADLLGSMIQDQEKLCEEFQNAVETAELELMTCEMQTSKLKRQYDQLLRWSDAFDNASPSARKMIASTMIDRVEVSRGYQLEIKFNISVEQFLFCLDLVA